MKLGDVNLAPVVDHAARIHIAGTNANVAETHERCRAWWGAFKPTVEVWAEYAYDLRSLVYRCLIAHLNGVGVYREPVDNRALGFVIAAGQGWDELPAHDEFLSDEDPECYVLHDFGSAFDYLSGQAQLTAQRRTMATIQKWS